MDEEAQKRKTDCVYFLASPLTCKKGNDCDYRHSESARINPRDCWFWLSGNCLHANCPFRHPPLDGRPLDGRPAVAATSVAPAVPASKSRVPCYYFSQGFCVKGDKCPFLHGPLQTQSTDTQKQPKRDTTKGPLPNDKEGVASQGNGSVTKPLSESSQEVRTISEIKPTSQSDVQTVRVKATRPTYEPVVMPSDAAKVSSSGCSGSSGPTRRQRRISLGEESSMKVSKIENQLKVSEPEDQLCLVQPPDERIRHGQSREDRLRHIQSHVQLADDRLCQAHLGNDKMQNGMESGEWWEESSPGFDVIVDDGLDQLVYPEEADDLSHHDITVESGRALSRGRVIPTDDLAELEYDHPGIYDQSGYYDASSSQYDHVSYDQYDQHPRYEHVSSYGHLDRQQAVVHGDKAVESRMFRDRHRIVTEEEIRHGIASDDLRNHISKRRRLERAQQFSGDVHRRRHHQETLRSSSPHGRRNPGHPIKQQEAMIHQVPAQQETRSNSRRSVGKAESGGNKRVYHDLGPDYGLVSPERMASRSALIKYPLGDHRVKGKDREGRQPLLDSATVSEHRGYDSSNKTDFQKDDSNFVGPKTLAQIKAEKRKASADASLKTIDMFNEHNITLLSISQRNHTRQHQGLPSKIRVSPVPGLLFDTICRGESSFDDGKRSLGMGVEMESIMALDFEGPKPLSAILKEKKKTKSENQLRPEEFRKERASKKVYLKPSVGAVPVGSMSSNINPASFEKDVEDGELLQGSHSCSPTHTPHDNRDDRRHGSKDVEDGELLQDSDSCSPTHMPHDNGDDRRHGEVLKEAVDYTVPAVPVRQTHVSVPAATKRVEEAMGERYGNVEGADTSGDMADGTEPGDNVLEYDEFGMDEEEEDDFAKKLGGFFP